jgi:hypothetical protein
MIGFSSQPGSIQTNLLNTLNCPTLFGGLDAGTPRQT